MKTLDAATDTRPAVAEEDEAAEAFEDPPEAAALTFAPHPSQSTIALHDIVRGAYAFRLWGRLGWQDIRKRYRRSKLGPFWITVSMGVLVTAMSTLYGALFEVEIADYVPFLALGFIVWGLISGLITEGCAVFTGAANIIKEARLPLSLYVYRVVWRNLIIFFHNIVIFVVVATLFSIRPGWAGLLALPGLVFLCLNGVWTGLLLGIVSARFRDLPPIVESIMRITFFVTPIIWMPSLLPERAVLLDFNPFFHVLELVRAPLLGQAPRLVSWLTVSGITLGGGLVTFELFRRYRRRIAYWV